MLFQEPKQDTVEVTVPDMPPCQFLPDLETSVPCGEASTGSLRVKVMKTWARIYFCSRHLSEHNENFMTARKNRRV